MGSTEPLTDQKHLEPAIANARLTRLGEPSMRGLKAKELCRAPQLRVDIQQYLSYLF